MKRLRIFSFILIFTLVFVNIIIPTTPKAKAVSQTAYQSSSPEVGTKSDFKYRVQNDRIYITEYVGTKTKLIIPETIDGKPVFAIVAGSFTGSDLTYLKLPSSLSLLGSNSFNECDSLTQIDVDEANTKFCSIDGVVYSKDKTVLRAFPAGRSGSFMIPDGVTTIYNYAFYRCYQLESVNMYNSVISIGERAFSFCWNLKNIRLSEKLKTISPFAFSHCNDLTEIHLPKSITSIGNDAFLGRVNSNDSSKEYYFVDGIYCVKGSYAAKFIKSLGLDYINEGTLLTDVAAGITVTDLKNILPDGSSIKVEKRLLSSIPDDFSNVKYTDAYVFDIYVSASDGSLSVPQGEFKINFDNITENLIPTATKLYSYRVGDTEPILFSLTQNSVSCETDALGTFIVLTSNDFSLKGDADGDGKVTLTDARITLIASAGIIELTEAQKSACDVITTGADKNVITTADARRILRTAAGLKWGGL